MARELSPQSPGRRVFMVFLFQCIMISLPYDVFFLSLGLCDIFHSPMARYSLFLLKVPLNTK